MKARHLEELLKIAHDDREAAWEEEFFKSFSESKVSMIQDEPANGPDSWPYMMVRSEEEATEPVQKLLEWLSTRGIGLVLNPEKSYPDYVFSYGMIWGFRETGLFIHPQADTDVQTEVHFEEGQKVLAGAPTEEYLPGYVRKVLNDFLQQQSIFQPKVLVVSVDQKNFDLAFSLDSFGNPPEEEHEGILEALSWFLPPHYSLILVPEDGLPGFVPLN